ncbi:MAG TPA: hypothetical protein VGB56_11200 [Flavisolibacter sp.]
MILQIWQGHLTIQYDMGRFRNSLFRKFVRMALQTRYTIATLAVTHVVVDLSDCYTWSFPEFLPFCPSLFYFSTFKDFHTFS